MPFQEFAMGKNDKKNGLTRQILDLFHEGCIRIGEEPPPRQYTLLEPWSKWEKVLEELGYRYDPERDFWIDREREFCWRPESIAEYFPTTEDFRKYYDEIISNQEIRKSLLEAVKIMIALTESAEAGKKSQ